MMFACNTTIAASPATLSYALSGTDVANFELKNEKVTITGTPWAAKLTGNDAKVTWAMSTELSSAPVTTMSGNCPDMGMAYGWFAPVGTTAPSDSNVASTANAWLKTKAATPGFNGADAA
jgi:hypothetical protein